MHANVSTREYNNPSHRIPPTSLVDCRFLRLRSALGWLRRAATGTTGNALEISHNSMCGNCNMKTESSTVGLGWRTQMRTHRSTRCGFAAQRGAAFRQVRRRRLAYATRNARARHERGTVFVLRTARANKHKHDLLFQVHADAAREMLCDVRCGTEMLRVQVLSGTQLATAANVRMCSQRFRGADQQINTHRHTRTYKRWADCARPLRI